MRVRDGVYTLQHNHEPQPGTWRNRGATGGRGRRPLAERAVSHFGVVLDPPLLDNNLRLPQRIENLPIQVLIPQLPAEVA